MPASVSEGWKLEAGNWKLRLRGLFDESVEDDDRDYRDEHAACRDGWLRPGHRTATTAEALAAADFADNNAPPATPPAAAPAPAPRPPAPFPEGSKFAFIDIQAIASNSVRRQGGDGEARRAAQEEEQPSCSRRATRSRRCRTSCRPAAPC